VVVGVYGGMQVCVYGGMEVGVQREGVAASGEG
jgi:hypothetical protein